MKIHLKNRDTLSYWVVEHPNPSRLISYRGSLYVYERTSDDGHGVIRNYIEADVTEIEPPRIE